MFMKVSSLIVLATTLSSVLATPPACMLACVAQVEKSSDCSGLNDLKCISGTLTSDIEKCFASACPNDNADAATSAYKDSCNGYALQSATSSAAPSSSSAVQSSSAAPTSSAKPSASSAQESSQQASSAKPTTSEQPSSTAKQTTSSKAQPSSSAAPTTPIASTTSVDTTSAAPTTESSAPVSSQAHSVSQVNGGALNSINVGAVVGLAAVAFL